MRKLTPLRLIRMPRWYYSSFMFYIKLFLVFIVAYISYVYISTPSYDSFRMKLEKGDKIIAIPMATDTSYFGKQLHRPFPFTIQGNDSVSFEFQQCCTYLHIAGDSCWLEHVLQSLKHIKHTHEPNEDLPATFRETTAKYLVSDTLALRP